MERDRLQAPAKPLLRGTIHQYAFFVALGAGLVMMAETATRLAAIAAGVYVLSLAGLLGISALYHRPNWPPALRLRMRSLDHAAIFLLIAGTYTPICLLALGPGLGTKLLAAIWAGAVVGIGQAVAWPRAPKAVSALIYVIYGGICIPFMPQVAAAIPLLDTILLAVGGGLYILGAIAYATHRPRLVPTVFGYHEVFHTLVVLAGLCHFIAVLHLVT